MSGDAQRIHYRRLRAPTGDGEVLIDPPLADFGELVARNRSIFAAWNETMGGRTIGEVHADARNHLIKSATQFTSQYADVPPASDLVDRPIYLVGHQPELFHPGVWLKNFVLDGLTQRDGAIAVHVQIDNDIAHEAAIRVPTGGVESPRLEGFPLDDSINPTPWEERLIQNSEQFKSAGRRIVDALEETITHPLAKTLWKDLKGDELEQLSLGQVLARMRHRLELSWGLKTLEVPLSVLCNSDPYRWFVASLISALPTLHESCNNALAEYRRVHKLRSPSHPIPDLKRVGDRFEAPFWFWTSQQPQRRPLFATYEGDQWRLDDGGDWRLDLSISNNDFTEAVRQLADLEQSGVKIRPRALTTTMFLRLFASDFFVHGIGGAKYDQVTDCVIQDIFGIQPPAFMTATGTRRLPVDLPPPPPMASDEIDQLLRDWEHHPETALSILSPDDAESKAELVREKQNLTSPDCQIAGKDRHAAILRVNKELRRLAPERREELLALRAKAESQRQACELLSSREFSFCLYPESALRSWLLGAWADTT